MIVYRDFDVELEESDIMDYFKDLSKDKSIQLLNSIKQTIES